MGNLAQVDLFFQCRFFQRFLAKVGLLAVCSLACGFSYPLQKVLEEPLQIPNALVEEIQRGENAFALAELFRSQEEFSHAIYWYKIRLEQGEFDQFESWFSYLMLGRCSEKIEELAEAVHWYMKAFNCWPTRPEPLYELARLYRIQGENHLGYFFAKTAQNFMEQMPSDASFFADFSPHLLDIELSITAYYTPYPKEGLRAADRLLFDSSLRWDWKDFVHQNLSFYVQPIETLLETQIEVPLPQVSPFAPDDYRPLNPSIIRTDTGYLMVLRSVNYLQEGGKEFITQDPEGKFRTRNFLLELDPHFTPLSQKEILESSGRKKNLGAKVEGLEDCRLIDYGSSRWVSCTVSDMNPYLIPEMALCRIGEDDRGAVSIQELTLLHAFGEQRCEKNWLPFVRDGSLFFIYSFQPFIIVQPNLQDGRCSIVTHQKLPWSLSHLRGSAPPIPFDRGWLLLTHEVLLQKNGKRAYLHRFVYLNQAYIVERVSKPFVFSHLGVEFCCSMTWNHAGDSLIIPYGFEDREARICSVSIATIQEMLEDASCS